MVDLGIRVPGYEDESRSNVVGRVSSVSYVCCEMHDLADVFMSI